MKVCVIKKSNNIMGYNIFFFFSYDVYVIYNMYYFKNIL